MSATRKKALILAENDRLSSDSRGVVDGLEVSTCRTVDEALELIRKNDDFQVFLADFQISGSEILRECQRIIPAATRIILSDDSSSGEDIELIRSGLVFRILRKPVSPKEVEESLIQAFEYYDLQKQLNHQEGGGAVKGKSNSTEDLYKKIEKLEEMDQFKNNLMMIVTHDIRSPLSVMVGYSNILLESEKNLSERGEKIIGRIQNTCTRLLGFVNNILDVSVIEGGKQKLEYEPTRLSEIIEAAEENLAGMIEDKNIDFSRSITSMKDSYRLDRHKAVQIIQNIFSNAIKVSQVGGKILITCNGEADLITFRVKDQGPGLSEKQKSLVFEKFVRFSDISQQGSGLGLAISKAQVELHGGKIWVEDNPGGGTTFTFTLAPGDNPS